MPGQFSIKHFPSLTAVVHETVRRAPSGLNAKTIAEIVGYTNYNTMMSEISRQPGHKLGADMLLPLMDATASHAPMHFLARELGGVFVHIPQASPESGEMVQQLAAVIKECSDFFTESAQDISDGDIPADQLARMQKEGHEALTAITKLLQLAQRMHETQYGKK